MGNSQSGAASRHRPGPVSVKIENLELLRELVRDHDLTLREFAQRIGCSVGHARHIHSGHTTRISLRLARSIERVLECPGGLYNPVMAIDRVDDDQSEITPQRVTA